MPVVKIASRAPSFGRSLFLKTGRSLFLRLTLTVHWGTGGLTHPICLLQDVETVPVSPVSVKEARHWDQGSASWEGRCNCGLQGSAHFRLLESWKNVELVTSALLKIE